MVRRPPRGSLPGAPEQLLDEDERPSTPVAPLVVGGRRRSSVAPRCCDFLPPVRARHHLPDLAVSELRMGLGGVLFDVLEQVFVIRAGELDPIVRRIYTVEAAHWSSFGRLTDRCGTASIGMTIEKPPAR